MPIGYTHVRGLHQNNVLQPKVRIPSANGAAQR